LEGIQTKDKDRRTGYTNRGSKSIQLAYILFYLLFVGLPHFRGAKF